jgi:hypothetical protein
MAIRDISDIVIYHALEKGNVFTGPKFDAEHGSFKCKVEYFQAGERVQVIAAIKPNLDSMVIVVTAYGDGEDGKF